MKTLLGLALVCVPLFAQLPSCPGATMWTTCDLAFDLESNENPSQTKLQAEFRSPRHRTYLLHAFQDGPRRLVIRFSPTEAGDWEFRLTSNVQRWNDQEGKFSAASSDDPGFIQVANVHHFRAANGKPHLWMSTALDRFAAIPRADFDAQVAQRAKEKFTHLRVTVDAGADLGDAADRVKEINAKGMIADIVLAGIPSGNRDAYLNDLVSRFAAMNVTWAGIPAFEETPQGRASLKSIYNLIGQYDPYKHPRATIAQVTSAPLDGDGWQDVISYGTVDPNVGSVEHQFYQHPAINTAIQSRADLWNATMNGQYPSSGSGAYMTAWAEFMADNRYWELEPYFDVKGGRATALEGTDYIVYVEKPGPVVMTVEKHGYEVLWMNPATGEKVKGKKFNAEQFIGSPPDESHDWVLQLVREGHMEGLSSYRFDSRAVPVQEIEINPDKTPFDVDAPPEGNISVKSPPYFALKVKRDTPATKSLLVEWTGEVTIAGQGYRVIGRGKEGTFRIPSNLANQYPSSLAVRVLILNANGKAYELDRVYRLTE